MNLFTYGSLMFSEVWLRVVGQVHENTVATISGFQRRAVKGVSYPCLIEADSTDQVDGVIYYSLSEREFRVLDDFEAEQYQRRSVTCQVNSELIQAEVYVWRNEYKDLVGGEWDVDRFGREGISRFTG